MMNGRAPSVLSLLRYDLDGKILGQQGTKGSRVNNAAHQLPCAAYPGVRKGREVGVFPE